MEGHSRDAKKEGKAGCSRRFSRRRRCSVLRSTKGRETEKDAEGKGTWHRLNTVWES